MRRREFLQQTVASSASLAASGKAPLIIGDSRSSRSPPLQVGSRKQLFIDDRFFDRKRGINLVVNRPVLTGERCVVADRAWEGCAVLAYNSVMDDEGTLKLWYERYR